MATIVLSAAGMAIGGSIGGSVLGLSSAVIGRAVGASLGRVIDQRLLGAGSEAVETGRIDRFRLTGASEGSPVTRLFGRMRIGGQVIWASRFRETSTTTGGGKGGPPKPRVTEYSYSVSLAVALCEGEITRVGRIWADGEEIGRHELQMNVYYGTADQMPDPVMEAVEGAGRVPAYRGVAYVVFEDLELGRFGNRVPQFTFEVSRPGQGYEPFEDLPASLRAVALMPGSGEYALATTQVTLSPRFGEQVPVNVNTPSGKSDLETSLDALVEELPLCRSVLLIVSWFGDDLRAGECRVVPKVEQAGLDAESMPWRVSGIGREAAEVVARDTADRPVYGGTPADASVIEALAALAARGQEAVFYPFLLMEQMPGNDLPDPYSGETGQPELPWRGRITTALAPGLDGTTDRTAAAEAEVAAFFGQAQVSDFAVNGTEVSYTGPEEFSYRRFILHYAHLCAAAGGISAFCIGSEMRGLTRIRGAGDSFPAVTAFRQLAADVRAILGPDVKISYAADWSEYHGFQPAGTADKYFHLDPLWADEEIDFIAIDNYMPLSDWRDTDDHADAHWDSIYNVDYLEANVAGGEGYDWFYTSPEARDAQRRTPIEDDQGEPWVWRYKDLRGWWSSEHHHRIDGPAGWVIPTGDRPDQWSTANTATTVPVPGVFLDGRFSNAVEVTDGGGNFLSRAVSPPFVAKGATAYRFRLFYVPGSADYVRVTLDVRTPAPSWIYVLGAPGDLFVGLSSGHAVSDVVNEIHPDGTHEVAFGVVFAGTDPEAQLGFGPGMNFAGQTVTFLGAIVTSRALQRTAWEPGSKPIWFTEFGCPAVDKGTNQPNKFIDPKSSESSAPYYSSGQRDELIQMQYLRAVTRHFAKEENNPVHETTGIRMVDMDRAHVWAWDARPHPAFPALSEVWTDSPNYARGHWITGRTSARPLDSVVAEICLRAGVTRFDVSRLYGLVRGYMIDNVDSARAALQPLMTAYAFDAVERDGWLHFITRTGRPAATLEEAGLARDDDLGGALEVIRQPSAEIAGRVRLSFVEADGDYGVAMAEAVLADDTTPGIRQSELPLVLTRAEGARMAERWLVESRVARDGARFALPPSRIDLGAGDVVDLPVGEGRGLFRVDLAEDAGRQLIEAVRVEPEVYRPQVTEDEPVTGRRPVAAVPVEALFLDLPLIRGDEVPHAPHVAMTGAPWPGSVALYSAPQDNGYVLNRIVTQPSIVGVTESPLAAAAPGLWDRGPGLLVRLVRGELASAMEADVLSGANLAAIGDGSAEGWELFQFAEAELVAPQTYVLRGRLRGQLGSDATVPAHWPEGSLFVLMNGLPEQIDLAAAARDVERHFRYGPAHRPLGDPSYRYRIETFRGIGLRPYSVCHLSARRDAAGADRFHWIRRTRIDGDSWSGIEVPLGEATESYLIRVYDGSTPRREAIVAVPDWTYSAAERASDGIGGAYRVEVAQISERFGPGPARALWVG